MNNKIPYSMTFKYFNETITLKKESPTLNIHDVMEMNKKIILSLFGKKAYEDIIIKISDDIYSKDRFEIELKQYEF
jgi:hypothetical protein